MNFKVSATEYNEKGALTDVTYSYTYNDPQVALENFKKLGRKQHVGEDGKETGIKMYKVEFFVQAWKRISEPHEFCAQFEVAE